MKICVGQTKSIKGDIQGNIDKHKILIDLAVTQAAELIIFPELSLTGYEPTLAMALALDQSDGRFDDFQNISNAKQITIGVGLPTKSVSGICISMVLFQPHQARQTYSKKYLHADEEPFFVSGQNFPTLKIKQTKVALAICYELSVPDHAKQAFKHGADVYIASVAKSMDGVENAGKRLAEIAQQYAVPVFMSNCVGPSDDFEGAGNTTIWNATGSLAGQLNATAEGILIFDTVARQSAQAFVLASKP